MKKVYDFLSNLSNNNNRDWFEAHKSEYLEAQAYFNSFSQELINEISKWDTAIDPDKLKVKDCTYRIYRDVRFSKNKLPYKTHMGVYVCRGGKKSSYAGYYVHIEPKNLGNPNFLGDNLLFVGLYRPDPKVVHSIRDEISVNGDSFLKAIEKAKGFKVTSMDVLKKVPKGYENVNPKWQELLKHKDFSIDKSIDDDFLFAPNLAERVSAEFKKAHEFSNILNMAVQYALEEL